MITLTEYSGKAVGVFGLGKAGEATVASLLAGGAEVFAWDDSEASRNALHKKFRKAKLLPIAQWPWTTLSCLALAPGVPLTHPAPHPAARLAQVNGCPVIGDIELLYKACPGATFVGITGTNGKSTTTSLLAHILKEAGRRVEVGGNLGTAALALAPLDKDGIYVLETSSYQLDLLKTVRFNVAVLLNITPDHLDRHGDMQGYIAAKMHIFDRQRADDIAVIATEDEYTRLIAEELCHRGSPRVSIVSSEGAEAHGITGIPTLTGRHNWQNAEAAYAAAKALGVPGTTIVKAMQSFPGLAHRLELVVTRHGVRFINDSKATNADATANALAPYDHIYWILGGKPKAGGIGELAPFFSKIAHAFLIGHAEQEFATTLEGKVPYTRCGTLDVAVGKASQLAFAEKKDGAVVLLSPACASFDQFKNFEARGDAFKALVQGVRMSMRLDRTNNSLLGRWWWTVDHYALGALVLLICFGFVLVAAASPPVAHRLHLPAFYFMHRHYIFLLAALVVMVVVSLLPSVEVRRLAVVGFGISVGLMLLVPFFGMETKGAHRWISIHGFSLQPSEFMKPCFAVVMAWICSERYKRAYFPGNMIAIGLYAVVVLLLLAQPDFGMTLTVTAMWGVQFFIAGLPIMWVLAMGGLGLAGIAGAYKFFPHVAKRIDGFLDPGSVDNYQVAKSLEAFENGGILGRGPGEGTVKHYLPDSHTDFVFSVAGEEFGMIACMVIVSVFGFVVLRALSRVWKEKDLFTLLAVAGLAVQFGIQAVVNMGVAVNLLPAKGMTLPFLSYGGSSVLAIALGMGMMLALTRRKFGSRE